MVDEQSIYPTEAEAQDTYRLIRPHLKPGLTVDAPAPLADGTWALRVHGVVVDEQCCACLAEPDDGDDVDHTAGVLGDLDEQVRTGGDV